MPFYRVVKEQTIRLVHIYEADSLILAIARMRTCDSTGHLDVTEDSSEDEYFGNEVTKAKRGEHWRDIFKKKTS